MKKLEIPQILLIEDRSEDAHLTRSAFEESGLGWDFSWIDDGLQASAFLRNVQKGKIPPPDLILLDLNLPQKDGRMLLAEMRKSTVLRKIPVIVITGSRSEEDIEACHRSGASSFVFKPNSWDQYRSMVQFVHAFWKSRENIPPVWINELGPRTKQNDSKNTSLVAATNYLLKAKAANDEEGFDWKQLLLIALNLRWAWESITSYGEEEIRADTGLHRQVEGEAPWLISRLSVIEKELVQLEGSVAELAYQIEAFSNSKKRIGPEWLKKKIETLVADLKGIETQENQIIVDQYIDLGLPG